MERRLDYLRAVGDLGMGMKMKNAQHGDARMIMAMKGVNEGR